MHLELNEYNHNFLSKKNNNLISVYNVHEQC